MPDNQNTEPVTSIRLRQAIEGLYEVLGRAMVDLLVVDLERQGIILGNDSAYSMARVEQALVNTFGSEGGTLLAEKIRKSLGSQQHSLR